MRISPAELRKRVDYYQERETLLKQQAAELEQRVLERTRELTAANDALRDEIAERKKAQAAVVGMSEQLADAAHRAGKAEIATNVLHNVGNVLNSVMVSVRVAMDRVRDSRVTNVGRVVDIVQAHQVDLARFLEEDPQGKLLPNYLKNLAIHLVAERDELLAELESVNKNADHIKHIISVQQEFAGVSNFVQATDIAALVDDAIRIATLEHEGVHIAREFDDLPRMMVHKHKVLQTLINLVSNAKHAVKDGEQGEPKHVCVRLGAPRDGVVAIAVIDNGMGIASADLERIFQHGFTTRKDGHGFGLHAAVNAAREMGGTLSAWSEGPGRGATFTLEIPCERAAEAAE
jgi:C4-dicarboxylate-specific signal transduction histidine kinase